MKNRRFILSLIGVTCCRMALAVPSSREYRPYPPPDKGYVTDLADVLTEAQEQNLENLLYVCEKEYGVEMAVVTIQSIREYPGTSNESIVSFARGLFNAYGIGNMPQNNGVLLLVAIQDRKARIELGAFYEHARDSDAERIMQKIIVSQFKRGHFDEGVVNGTRALIREFGGMAFYSNWIFMMVVATILVLIPISISLFRNGKRGWGWICAGVIIILVLASWLLVRKLGEKIAEGSACGRSGGSGGSGGFGGGFGGGSSGGGGATGSW